MKKNLLFILLLIAGSASSQTITHHYEPYLQEVVAGGLLSCNDDDGSPHASSYFTNFKLSNPGYEIEGDEYVISSVEFGIEEISGVASYPITVRLYSTNQMFPTGFATLDGYTLKAEQTFQVPAQELDIYSAAINATIPTDSWLVVEISYEEDPDGEAVMLLGGNPDGSWGTTWTTSAECGVTSPTDMASLAAENGIEGSFAMVLNVVGEGGLGLEGHNAKSIDIYPNPTTGLINLPSEFDIKEVTITDVTGKTIILPLKDNNTIDIANLSNGMYYITVESESGIFKNKIIKR